MWKLEIVDGPAGEKSVGPGDVLEIGRGPDADLRLDDRLVSRRHARLLVDAAGTVVIEDLGSSNGTIVNDREIAGAKRLASGDVLIIGSCTIRLRSVARGAGPAAPPDALAAARDARLVGSVVANHRILGVVARGGMGVIYRAQHLRIGRVVALKLLPPELAANEGFQERFERESRLAAAIDHPHIVPLYDAGTVDGLPFLTMRFVDGLDLGELLRRDGPLELVRAVSIVAQIGSALDAAHSRGLVHRDIKPANILVEPSDGPHAMDHCYLTDFGLTRDTAAAERLTKPGQFVGTIDYVAPEQINADGATGAVDRYALGCVLYECLTGGPPFRRATELEVLDAHIRDPPPSACARCPGLPSEIDDVILRAMAKEPLERFSSCAEMASAARAAAGSRPRAT